MIEVRNLTKRYGPTLAVDDLTFTVAPGRVTGFLGPNGAGKSTTMRMMLGLDVPAAGDVLVDGKPYHALREPLRHVGALLEAKAVHPGRSARNHLLWLAQTNGIGRARVREVIDLVGLGGAVDRRAGEFSLGMGQRLGIAAALLGDPAVLLLDEPVNGLDPEGIRWIRTLMRDLAAEGRAVFVSSHLMSEMALTADHLVVIGRGRLLADTDMAGFIRRNARSHVLVRTPDPARMLALLTAAGIGAVAGPDDTLEVDEVEPARIGALAAADGLAVDELSPRTASLEEAFMRLTADSVEFRAADGAGR
ncbi:ABC transporter ATP-binding protein [Actinokineospora enzanensis]|uniref:ABC transporter ATP-binding protein n=1 Tax=Actinokineospora enzanensis TaxID=155975 RepID=UPI00036B5E05|nr:ATP-binding cassette domain-containing protein [Actinokineospora enzanensis]